MFSRMLKLPRDVRERSHVDRQQRADDEEGDECEDRYPFRSHEVSFRLVRGHRCPALAPLPRGGARTLM